MDMLENKGAQKRRKPSVKALVLAAALAVGCVLSIAAGLPARVYNFVAGGQAVIESDGRTATFTFTGEEAGPLTVENGRLWFESDGEKTDITDKVDENTPYIHEHTDPATKEKGYVIVGGTIDNYGWAEIVQMDGAAAITGSNFADVSQIELLEPVEAPDGVYVADEYGDECHVVDIGAYRPWFQAAMDQLGLDF